MARPQSEILVPLVAEILGPKAANEDVRLCAASIMGQIVFHRLARPMISRLMPEQKYDEAAILRLSRHIARFSLAALKSLRAGL
jgi:hypothetical protein